MPDQLDIFLSELETLCKKHKAVFKSRTDDEDDKGIVVGIGTHRCVIEEFDGKDICLL